MILVLGVWSSMEVFLLWSVVSSVYDYVLEVEMKLLCVSLWNNCDTQIHQSFGISRLSGHKKMLANKVASGRELKHVHLVYSYGIANSPEDGSDSEVGHQTFCSDRILCETNLRQRC